MQALRLFQFAQGHGGDSRPDDDANREKTERKRQPGAAKAEATRRNAKLGGWPKGKPRKMKAGAEMEKKRP